MKRVLVIAALLGAVACGDGEPAAQPTPTPTVDPKYCASATTLDEVTASVDASLTKPAVLRTRFPKLEAAFAAAKARAPEELKGDFTFLEATLKTFKPALVRADYDFSKLAEPLQQLATSPSSPVANARARVRAYAVANCGLEATPSATPTST